MNIDIIFINFSWGLFLWRKLILYFSYRLEKRIINQIFTISIYCKEDTKISLKAHKFRLTNNSIHTVFSFIYQIIYQSKLCAKIIHIKAMIWETIWETWNFVESKRSRSEIYFILGCVSHRDRQNLSLNI